MPRQTDLPTYEELMSGVEPEGFHQTPNFMTIKAIHARLTGADWALWGYLLVINPKNDVHFEITFISKLAWAIGTSERQVNRLLRRLKDIGILPKWVVLKDTNNSNTEQQIRERLHQELGGLKEVPTPAGRIDLLTDKEIIEIKTVSDWKAAIGQVVAYSGFYPEHRKRIHLFGRNGATVNATAATICLELDIIMTFEEVEL